MPRAPRPARMVVIGLTGGVGTGKSTVGAMFRELGATVVSADLIAHELMRPGRPAWREIVRDFGRGILAPGRRVDRRRLGRLVFQDARKRRRLEAIMHPRVLGRITAELRRLRREGRAPAAVVEVPLLFEAGADRLVDTLVVVTAPPALQRRRLRKQHGWGDREIRARIGAQWEVSAKAALADHVVENSGGVGATRTQVKRLWNRLVPVNSSRSSISRR